MSKYILVVDTDRYAGGFERALTAYCTGVLGECGVGGREAERFRAEHPERVQEFEDLMEQVADEDSGCRRPTAIWPTVGWFNDGLGSEYPDDKWGSPEVLAKYRESAAVHKLKNTEPSRSPAYMSVAMFLTRVPSAEVLGFMRSRAQRYAQEVGFQVQGFRLLRTQVTTETLEQWGD